MFITCHLQHLLGSDFKFQTHMFRLSLDFRLTGSDPQILGSSSSFIRLTKRFTKQVHKTRFRFHKNKFTYSTTSDFTGLQIEVHKTSSQKNTNVFTNVKQDVFF